MVHSDYLPDQNWDPSKNDAPVKEILLKYITRWPLFLLGLALAVSGGFFYLYITTPLYEAQATVLIRDGKGEVMNELIAFEDLGILTQKNNLENEIEIIKSRTLMSRVVKELGLNFRYFIDKKPRKIELYQNNPFYVTYSDTTNNRIPYSFYVEIKSDQSIHVSDIKGENRKTILAGVPFQTPSGLMTLYRKEGQDSLLYTKILVQSEPIEKSAATYSGAIKIEHSDAKSNVIRIKLKDPVQRKAIDIIQSLIKQYRVDAIEDKNQVSLSTATFINERIKFITLELDEVENSVQNFKTGNKLLDIPSEAGVILESETSNEKAIVETAIQEELALYVLDYLQKENTLTQLLPANLGLADGSVAAMISKYNELVLERNRFSKNSSERNPVSTQLEEQLINLKKSIGSSLKNLTETLRLKKSDLLRQAEILNTRIAALPRYEREFREIQRQQQIKESLYLYLLQKREETAIALAVTVSNAKIIDQAQGSSEVISPDKRAVFSIAVLLGLLLPATLIYLRGLLDTKIHGRKDLIRSRIPFVGEIPAAETEDKLVVKQDAKSGISEAFRSLRTNISFMLNKEEGKGSVIFLTSSLAREGKTFLSINLSTIMAATGKRVLLVGLDLRTPKIPEYLGLEKTAGLTNYLISDSLSLEDLILPVPEVDNFYVLPSGDIPPNPAELLMTDKLKESFAMMRRHFDYIVVDTAPASMVTDTILVSELADVTIYILRAGFTDKSMLSISETLYNEKKLHNMAYLINDTRHSGTYGYAYGYGYGVNEKKHWWQFRGNRN